MGQDRSHAMSSEKSSSFLEKVRGVRDSAMEDLAKVTLAWTSSHTFQALNAVVSKPAMLATVLMRKASESAMADLLARLHMPSREDVLALSKRLTRIEMVLDDVGAGIDQLRAGSNRQQRPAARERENNGEPRQPGSPAAGGL
jgi:hypothetical protein